MEPREAQRLAKDLMDEFGLIRKGWTFRFDNAKLRFGVCRHAKKEISISRPLTQLNERADVEDVIRHEIAHAITDPAAGHGWRWVGACHTTGARPEQFYDSGKVEGVAHKWRVVCPACGWSAPRHRRKTGNYFHCQRGEWVYYEEAA
jgi:predicted SprT family Zn-dependent metalloprotease